MLHLTIENEYGERLDFTNNNNYVVMVTGLTPTSATINTSKIALNHGTKYTSSTINERNILLTIYPTNSVEKSRINLYKYIRLGRYIKLYLKNGMRDVWIDGHVENIEGDLYESPQKLQVSIICSDPFFKSRTEQNIAFSTIIPLFTFPFSINSDGVVMSQVVGHMERNIYNESDVETGAIIELYSNDLALEPTIYNVTTGEMFIVKHEFETGDVVRIDTRSGECSLTLIRNGIETNILNQMERRSKWFKLRSGDNIFTYTAAYGAENLRMTVKLQPTFTGV